MITAFKIVMTILAAALAGFSATACWESVCMVREDWHMIPRDLRISEITVIAAMAALTIVTLFLIFVLWYKL